MILTGQSMASRIRSKNTHLRRGILNVMLEVRNDLIQAPTARRNGRLHRHWLAGRTWPPKSRRGRHMSGLMRGYISSGRCGELPRLVVSRCTAFCSHGHFAVVIDQQDLLSAVTVDAGNGAVCHGGLLHSGWTLFDSTWVQRADGLSVRRMEPAQEGVV